MSLEEQSGADATLEQSKISPVAHWYDRRSIHLAAILSVATGIRVFRLDQTSLWYDEVVTMRLARTESPTALFRLLGQIDATRAPLHPLLLQSWITLFGPSDTSGRVFSVLCGVIVVALVYWIGLNAFDATSALWAAWLCSVSPLLVYYSRETRMYMWLVLVTCLAWGLLLSYGRTPRRWKLVLYGFALVAVVYSHPLGLLMVGALGMASLIFRREFHISLNGWFYTHVAVALGVAPWVGQYLDHPPESTTGLLSLRYLFGMPIGFIGGNFTILIVCSLLIAYGLFEVHRQELRVAQIVMERPAASISLLIWLLVPTLLLYVYSRIAHPIFGPARYTLFAGPAYLILVARGLAKLPWFLGLTTAVAATFLSGATLNSDVYRPDLKAGWNELAKYLDTRDSNAMVAVISADRSGNTELETARYYLEPAHVVLPWPDRINDLTRGQTSVWVSTGLTDGQPSSKLPAELGNDKLIQEVIDFTRLRLLRIEFHQALPFEK